MKIRRIMLPTLFAVLLVVSTTGCAAPSVYLKAVRTDHFLVVLSLTQGQAQSDEVTVDVKDLQGNGIAADSVNVQSSMPAMGHSLPDVTATGDGQGHYHANVSL